MSHFVIRNNVAPAILTTGVVLAGGVFLGAGALASVGIGALAALAYTLSFDRCQTRSTLKAHAVAILTSAVLSYCTALAAATVA